METTTEHRKINMESIWRNDS